MPSKPTKSRSKQISTSWEPVSKWYHQAVGKEGHYYHQSVILPKLLNLLNLNENSSVLDVACGQGILARHLPEKVAYVGMDIAPSFIKAAKQLDRNPQHEYLVRDAAKPYQLGKRLFSHATLILAVQNFERADLVFHHVSAALAEKGLFVIVMNHPCFRIPRQSSWGIDESKKLQYRRLDSYASAQKIPIQAHPSEGHNSSTTWSFHHPLSSYTRWLHEAGFVIEFLEEWCSDKVSEGKRAKMENRSRDEFPLFLTLIASKR
ncbi:class I SAM-dependent methyltransferase [Parachlamydia sp. AcF125]|uniref:class I SAM-dependent methyltransferase n=1 Tax=Parachlamydia sp. AcF125 TaxID=2795736 RepID=UPI001BC950DE|nr:class I SAM-dependent methyltransferase [Parachlamydia sp. AcF125]MBS4169157.1 Ubiquinone/menaquinone biosynthesis C-methyltransferase UbiE [Parachlamydia sp. AcF125]